MRLSWERVRHAIGYELEVALSDGQRLYFPAPAKQRALKLSTVASRQNGIVTIRAIDRLHRKGPDAALPRRTAALIAVGQARSLLGLCVTRRAPRKPAARDPR
ncbi:MAG TPA: hypothetical protein VGV90_05775 [Solirubrobacteraceae bacterium]|nr:hypothetical protein [Solirubrobacteraceae bacterium]